MASDEYSSQRQQVALVLHTVITTSSSSIILKRTVVDCDVDSVRDLDIGFRMDVYRVVCVCALVEMLVLERDMRLRSRDGPRGGKEGCDAGPPLIFLEASG